MSDADNTVFGKYVPGFDFLQSLAQGAGSSIPQMPNMGNWIAPTLNVEELDKRISELKSVHFWLEQNARALGATIQALEVQKMTLSTLKGMNFNLSDMANALKLKAADTVASGVHKAAEKASSTAKAVGDMANEAGRSAGKTAGKAAQAASGGIIDPLQLWGSLTQQFQQIASNAMKEVTSKAAVDLGKTMASGLAKDAVKSATGAAKKAASAAPRKTAARKTARK